MKNNGIAFSVAAMFVLVLVFLVTGFFFPGKLPVLAAAGISLVWIAAVTAVQVSLAHKSEPAGEKA